MNNDLESTFEQTIETFKDEDAFEKGVRGKIMSMAKTLATLDPKGVLEVLHGFVNTAGDVAKFTEYQETKRTEIRVKRDEIVKEIQSKKEIILTYLNKSFDERKENFAKLFSVVDNAIANNNTQQLAIGLDSINKLAAESPFKALTNIEGTRLALGDKSHEWDV